jgi:NDP-sugar pyrophosphorylase family protein
MQMTKPTLLVLAAGMGSRYGGLKQIDPVGPSGETIIDYSVFDAIRAGFGRFVFVIRREHLEEFREVLNARFGKQVKIEYAFQALDDLPAGFSVPSGRKKPWGTCQAILSAAELIREPFAAINADDFYGPNSYRVLAGHLTSGSQDYAMVGFVLRNTLSNYGKVARGICTVGADGYLESVLEVKTIEPDGDDAKYTDAAGTVHRVAGDRQVSMSMWGFTPKFFDQLRAEFPKFLAWHGHEETSEYLTPDIVDTLIVEGRAKCKVLRTPDTWFGVTYREDRPRVVEAIQKLISRGDYPEKLWS